MNLLIWLIIVCSAIAASLISFIILKREQLPNFKQIFTSFDLVFILAIFFMLVIPIYFNVRNYERFDLLVLLRWNILLFFGYVISVEDFKRKRIPNEFVLGMIAVWTIFAVPQLFIDTDAGVAYLVKSILGFLVGGGLFLFVYLISKQGLGGGDVKFMAAAGLYLGLNGVLPVILYGSVLSALVGITLILLKRIERKDAMPLAPFLYIGIIVTVFVL